MSAIVVDVFVRIDEAGHRAHALGVDRLQPLCRRRARGYRHDLAAAHDDRARLDYLAAANDDSGVGDCDVLRSRHARNDQTRHRQTYREKRSLHRSSPAVATMSGGRESLYSIHLSALHRDDVSTRRIANQLRNSAGSNCMKSRTCRICLFSEMNSNAEASI
jgi:hypothetical protein